MVDARLLAALTSCIIEASVVPRHHLKLCRSNGALHLQVQHLHAHLCQDAVQCQFLTCSIPEDLAGVEPMTLTLPQECVWACHLDILLDTRKRCLWRVRVQVLVAAGADSGGGIHRPGAVFWEFSIYPVAILQCVAGRQQHSHSKVLQCGTTTQQLCTHCNGSAVLMPPAKFGGVY